MRRRRVVMSAMAAMAAVVLVGGAAAWQRLATGGEVTEIGVDGAVERYRESAMTDRSVPSTSDPGPTSTSVATADTGSPTAPSTDAAETTSTPPAIEHSLPEPGVYAYVTTGFDSVDALTGARHDYPSTTTITVTPHDCGVRLRWDVAEERWDTWDWCLEADAVRLTGWVGYHEFFDVVGRNAYRCDGDPRPLDAAPGFAWTTVCRMEDRTTSTFTGEVVERTELEVAGTPVPVLRVRVAADVIGESTGSQVVEGWYRVTDGLPVRETMSIATAQDTVIGTTNFTEQYTIELQALEPLS